MKPLMPEADLSALGVAHGVVVRPGDTLVVGLTERLSRHVHGELQRRVAEFLPGVIVVFMECVSQFAVCRSDSRED